VGGAQEPQKKNNRESLLEAELNDLAVIAAREHQRTARLEATIAELAEVAGAERRRADAAERELATLRQQLPSEWEHVRTSRGKNRWRRR